MKLEKNSKNNRENEAKSWFFGKINKLISLQQDWQKRVTRYQQQEWKLVILICISLSISEVGTFSCLSIICLSGEWPIYMLCQAFKIILEKLECTLLPLCVRGRFQSYLLGSLYLIPILLICCSALYDNSPLLNFMLSFVL